MRLATLALSLLLVGPLPSFGGVFLVKKPDGSVKILNIPSPSLAVRVPTGGEGRSVLYPLVESIARTHGLDPHLVDLVIRMESAYNPRAVSSKGAKGVMQLMPQTAALYGVGNVFDVAENLQGGIRYLRDLLNRFNFDLAKALAAYNAGPAAVERHGGVPPYPETQRYVSGILAAYNGKASPALGGGFGRSGKQRGHRRSNRPVGVEVAAGRLLVRNINARGEATIGRRLSLR